MTLNRGQTVGFDLSQLDRSDDKSTRHPYLGGRSGAKYIFLYHAYSANPPPLHVFALFLPTGTVKVHLVDPATSRQAVARLPELYTDLRRERLESYGFGSSVIYPDDLSFSTSYHSTEATALKAISRELGLLEDRSFTVILSSRKDQAYFDSRIPRLSNFPVLSMSKARAAHTLDVFPWQSHVGSKMLNRYLSCGTWLDRLILLADYYDIPIGHLEDDQPIVVSDLSLARRLTQQDMVLWWSSGVEPDLGGIENDRKPVEEFPDTEFTIPGSYSNVCLEVTVRNLAVNAVLHSLVVNELEGAGGTTAFDSVSRTLNEYANGDSQRDASLGESNVSPQMFSILKSMVKAWLLDKVQAATESPASLAVEHFWRWISSSGSQMYDPSIHRFVHGLMRKTFIQLLAEYKRLGSTVVYADFSRILLATSKPPGTAHAYATYINTAVTSHELFEHIYLRTERFYDYLLFMDQANMGGIVCEDPLAIIQPADLSIEMSWNIAHFLPLPIQPDFTTVVQYFIVEMYRIRSRLNEAARIPLRMIPNGTPDSTHPRNPQQKNETEVIKDFVDRRLTRKLLKTVGSIQARYRDAMLHEDTAEDWRFPTQPGSHLHFTNPPLEFVKFVCASFALARESRQELDVMRKNLLSMVGMRAFGNETAFRNPCEPLKLSNIPCRHCDMLRDFDFCRDEDLRPTGDRQPPHRWACQNCGGEYDRLAIEFSLINMLFAMERRFAQQDLRCGKCKQIQTDNVSRYCRCSGPYEQLLNNSDQRRRVRTMVNVAIVHQLTRLKVRLARFNFTH